MRQTPAVMHSWTLGTTTIVSTTFLGKVPSHVCLELTFFKMPCKSQVPSSQLSSFARSTSSSTICCKKKVGISYSQGTRVLVREATVLWKYSSHICHLGKTVFLLYLLLYRLRLKCPTAVQFTSDKYIVFKSDGVFVCPMDSSIDHWVMVPAGCWCLTDGNAYVMQPCEPFARADLRTFLITLP